MSAEYNINPKDREEFIVNKFRELTEKIGKVDFDPETDVCYCGYEGVNIYGSNGLYYTMSYKNDNTWNISIFPNDIYSKKKFVDGKWVER